MTDIQNQILTLIKSFAVPTHGHSVYMLAANREYFSYIILDEAKYTRVDGETNGDMITSSHTLTEHSVIAAVKEHIANELRTSSRGDFPWQTSKIFSQESDLMFYLQRLRALYDASSSPDYMTKFWWPNTDHTAWLENGTLADVSAWVQAVFAVEVPSDSTNINFFYKNKTCDLKLDSQIRSGFLQVHLQFSGAPMELAWHSSIGLARSLFVQTGKAALCPPCMMSQDTNHLYKINADGEGLIVISDTVPNLIQA